MRRIFDHLQVSAKEDELRRVKADLDRELAATEKLKLDLNKQQSLVRQLRMKRDQEEDYDSKVGRCGKARIATVSW